MKSSLSALQPYLKKIDKIELNDEGIPACPIPHYSAGMRANIDFLRNPDWRKYYFSSHHRDETFRARWLAVTGSWEDKVVVDIGCGPGNVYATVGGAPKVLIGVDISVEALLFAKTLGYRPLLADVQILS